MNGRLFLATALWIFGAVAAAADAGVVRLEVAVEHRPDPVPTAVFYPADAGGDAARLGANPVFRGVPVRVGATVATGEHPVVLLSPGLGGRLETLAWWAAALANRGAVVIAVSHPGATAGDFDLRSSLDHGARALDLSAALSTVAQEPTFVGRLDLERVAAAGFSLGGWTALALGGARADLAAYAAHCDAVGARSTHCAEIANEGIDLRALDAARWNASYRDPRVDAVVAVDPGLTWGLDAAAVAELVGAVGLVTLGDAEHRLFASDITAGGSGFAALLPEADVLTITPAFHFSALLACTPAGPAILEDEGEPPVCSDPGGADRDEIHRRIVAFSAARLRLD